MTDKMFYKARIYEKPLGGEQRKVAENWLPTYEAAHKWVKEYVRWNKTLIYSIDHEPAKTSDD